MNFILANLSEFMWGIFIMILIFVPLLLVMTDTLERLAFRKTHLRVFKQWKEATDHGQIRQACIYANEYSHDFWGCRKGITETSGFLSVGGAKWIKSENVYHSCTLSNDSPFCKYWSKCSDDELLKRALKNKEMWHNLPDPF
jgi:hypothetical protein